MSKLEELQSFIHVIEESGIRAAAEKRHLSAPAITKHIQSLENKLGIALFDRAGRTLKPTVIGKQYYVVAVQALKNLKNLEDLIQTGKKQIAGVLTVRTTQYQAHTILLPGLKKFLTRYPKLQLNLEIHESLPNFSREAVDIVFGASIAGEPDWIQKKIGVTRYVLCATPAYFKQFGKPKKMHDLSQHRYLTHTGRRPDTLIRFQNTEITVAPYLWFNSYDGLIQAALEDLGLIWVHEEPIEKYLEQKKLVEVLKEESLKNQVIYLYYPSERASDPKIRAFIDFYS